MAKTYTDYTTRVKALVEDKSKISGTANTDTDEALASAISVFNEYEQRWIVVEETGTGARLYDLPDEFEESVSEGFKIEYPVDDEAGEVQYLNSSMYEIYNTPTGKKLRFRATPQTDFLPATGETFRIHLPVSHVLTTDSVTVPDAKFGAVSKLAARELCRIIGQRFLQQASSVNATDPADYRDKADKFLSYAKEFWNDFLRSVAPDKSEIKAASSFGSFVEDPLNRARRDLYPRDPSLRTDYYR